jgi:O-acetyl-ADP-ribose deacetylase
MTTDSAKPRISVSLDDLAFFDGEAIVRPVNATLGATTPIIRRLEEAGGATLAQQLRVQHPLAVGSAVVTAAGELPVDFLVHAVVMSDNEPVTRSGVWRATTSAMQRATDWELATVAVAPLGLGAGNLDVEDAADVMLDAIEQHLARARFPRAITIVVETPDERAVFERRLERMQK